MNPDQQRRFFLLEFSSWTERFLRYMTAAVIALLVVVMAQSFFSVGGEDAQFLVYTFGLLTLAVGAQFLIFWARIGRGFRISGITAFFFPWLALLALDAYLLSETPWRSQYAFCVNLLPLMAFFTAIHISRTKRSRWRLISLTAILVLISGFMEFLYPSAGTSDGAESVGAFVRNIFSGFGNTAAIGAALLLVFFSMAVLVACARFKPWARVFGVYMAVLFLAGIAFTRHVGVYLGFLSGGMLATALLVRRKKMRLALFAVIVACAVLSISNSNLNVGCLKRVPVPESVRNNFTDEERLADTRFVLPHAAFEMFKAHPVFGVGAGRFCDEFEKYRPPQWQTNPRTAGSLPLQILAEHGLFGIVLFAAPMIFLLVWGVRSCRKLSWWEDNERAALRRKMGVLDLGSLPEERVALAGTLSGLLAVAVLFAVDYPKNIPGISIACAVFGGIAAFILSEKRRRMIIYSNPRRHILLPVAFLAPVVLMWIFLPTFRAEAEFQKGSAELLPFYANPQTGQPLGGEAPDYQLLGNAETHLRAALRKKPEHGDSWNALAEKFVFDCRRDPMNTAKYGKYIATASAQALNCSSDVDAFFRTRAIAEMMKGDFAGVEANLSRADAMAPFNAAKLLSSAEIYRAFPQGADTAAKILNRVGFLLPRSNYVENVRALLSLDNNLSGSDGGNASPDETVVPEF